MKKILLFLLITTFSTVFAQLENEEFRATWIVTWDYINSGSSVEQNKERIRSILDKHVEANMNAVFFQVRQSGTAYYNSSYEPWGYYAGSSYPGFDPLEFAVEEAHKRGLELHAWFNSFHVSSTAAGTISQEKPSWICMNEDNQYMTSSRCASPGLEPVREYTVNVAMEVVNNYDIDGLHLDFIRWNEYDEDDMKKNITKREEISVIDGQLIAEKAANKVSPQGTKRYIYDVAHKAGDGIPEGFSDWASWRRWAVTEFVKTLHDSIQVHKPWVRLSAAALGKYREGGESGWNGYYIVFQDAAKWFREGYIDQLTPMHYHWTSGSGFVNNLVSDWLPYIQQGIDEKRLYTCGPGSYILDENDVWGNHPDIVNSVRTRDWVDGFQFYAYSSWNNHDYWGTAAESFFAGKTKIRKVHDVPVEGAPTIAINKIDSVNYDLTVTPVDTISQKYWFAIYRSKDDDLSKTDDQIIDLIFTDSEFTYREDFHDASNFTGEFRYFATMLNRYWNESGASNVVKADSISLSEPLPETPGFAGAFAVDNTTVKVNVTEVDYADGYAVAYGTDGETFADTATSSTSEVTINDLPTGDKIYFQVLAFNERGYSPASTQLYGAGTGDAPQKVLVVNGFDRATNSRLDYVREYASPIVNAGYGFSYVLNEAVYDGLVDLTDFDIVVWILGDESTADDTFNPTEQDRVEDFLKAGGKLFVSGAEIGWDLEGRSSHATTADISFYHNFLKAKYVADAPGNENGSYYTAAPTADGLFAGLDNFFFDDGTHGSYDVDWPDAIDPIGGSNYNLVYSGAPTSSNKAAVHYTGLFPDATTEGALVYSSIPFETIYESADRDSVMSKILGYLTGQITEIEDDLFDATPKTFALQQNYPNPFNPSTTIRFNLPEAGNVKLAVYNILGERVAMLLNQQLQAGTHNVNFNASNLSSGTYIYTIETGKHFESRKMILLK